MCIRDRHSGRHADAAETLMPALVACSGLGLVRPILDGGPACLEIVHGISSRLNGDPAQPSGLAEFLLLLLCTGGAAAPPADAEPTLTDREREILQLVAQQRSNREIAQELHLGINTVKWYLKRLFSCLLYTSPSPR